MPNVYIIAGPNGAGKTTFARRFLPQYAQCTNFVNADLIAQGLSPLKPEAAAMRAGRLVLEEIEKYRKDEIDFGFETTLSGKTYVSLIERLKQSGYKVHFFYLWLPSVDMALRRIKLRVAKGGHNVPADDVRRRFGRSIDNFFLYYRFLADSWMLFDSSGRKPKAIALERKGKIDIIQPKQFERLAPEYDHAQEHSKTTRRRTDGTSRGRKRSHR